MDTCSPGPTSRSTPVRIGRTDSSGSSTSRLIPVRDSRLMPPPRWRSSAAFARLLCPPVRSQARSLVGPARHGLARHPVDGCVVGHRHELEHLVALGQALADLHLLAVGQARVTARSSCAPSGPTTQTLPCWTVPWTAVTGTTRTFSATP